MIKECNATELKQKLEAHEKFQFIDCREQKEWEEAHIEGAKLLPLSEFEVKYEDLLKNKNEPIVIQCRSGARSMKACIFLLSKGYTDLTNLEGGIMGWMQMGYPVKNG
ncbi:MAG: rhodanese-like domain-containing protein [Bacteriovorax sp.]|jgi:rhodanese-related sulfurtransferase